MTFFDSLEHFESLSEIRKIASERIVVSYPKQPDADSRYWGDWKHYRPGEHHYYFTPEAVARLFNKRIVTISAIEDRVRGDRDGETNIETVVLEGDYVKT